MKIAFFSNYFIHHQEKMSLKLFELTSGQYRFICCENLPEERLNIGYQDMNKKYDFLIRPYESEEEKLKAEKLAVECDIMIFGSGSEHYVKLRKESGRNKIILRYSERLFKKGRYRILLHKLFKKNKEWFNLSKNRLKENENTYMLCSSAYTSYDLKPFHFDRRKCIKWGYFTECVEYDITSLMKIKKANEIKILWCGRFLWWKHPEKAIYVADKLKKKNVNFRLTMVGNGPKIDRIKKLISNKNLEDRVVLTGSVPSSDVRMYMEESDIFLFTSDFNEGWGAVLNESMNSGCAVVSSHAIGSVPFLIKDGENGFIYKNSSFIDLFNKVLMLCNDEKMREKFGKNAYYTIRNEWNPDMAAQRLYKICENLFYQNTLYYFDEGPCSIAHIVENNWYK